MSTPIAYTLMKSLALKFLLTDSFLAVIWFCRGLTHFGSVEVSLNPEMDFNGPSELRKMSKETQWICCDNISPTASSPSATLSRFDSMRFFFMGLFEISGLCRSTTDHSTPQEQHSRRHCQHTDWYAAKSGYEFQKSTSSVYTQWGSPFTRCHIQDCMKTKIWVLYSQLKKIKQ